MKKDLAASFQKTVSEIMAFKMKQALKLCREKSINISAAVISGGVAANTPIRDALKKISEEFSVPFSAPPIKFCTDNGVMIAHAGLEKFQKNQFDTLDFKPRPRWPLSNNSLNRDIN